MFAVIKTGGKQYRVAEKDVITIDKVTGAPGDLVQFAEVLILGGDNVMVGTPTVAGASVAGEVVEQTRGAKVIAFKKRRRKNSRRKRGHRQQLSVIRITEILTDGRKPTPRAQATEPAATPEVEAGAAGEAGASETAEATPAKKRASKPAKTAE
jgi:large subunit ribosomal protein L21